MRFLHPLTVIVIGVSAWVAALSISWPWLHLAIIVVGWAAGIAGSRTVAVPATSIALSIPAGLSMLLVHAPHGEHQIAPLLTSDGLLTAGELALRFCALMTSLLAVMANVHIPIYSKRSSTLACTIPLFMFSALPCNCSRKPVC